MVPMEVLFIFSLKGMFSVMLAHIDCYRHLFQHPERLEHLNTVIVESSLSEIGRLHGMLHRREDDCIDWSGRSNQRR